MSPHAYNSRDTTAVPVPSTHTHTRLLTMHCDAAPVGAAAAQTNTDGRTHFKNVNQGRPHKRCLTPAYSMTKANRQHQWHSLGRCLRTCRRYMHMSNPLPPGLPPVPCRWVDSALALAAPSAFVRLLDAKPSNLLPHIHSTLLSFITTCMHGLPLALLCPPPAPPPAPPTVNLTCRWRCSSATHSSSPRKGGSAVGSAPRRCVHPTFARRHPTLGHRW